jgi:hypothetical protein
MSAQVNFGGGSVLQQFERGQIVFSKPQNMIVAAFFQKNSDLGFGLDWNVVSQYKYDFFIVRWSISGIASGQHDVKAATSGAWTIPVSSAGFGNYQIVIEGCHRHAAAPATCEQSWTFPVALDYPAYNSCFRTDPSFHWVFLDLTLECGAPVGRGFSVAVYSAPCPNSSCNFGFFEGADESELSFNAFVAKTLMNNASRNYSSTGVNTYTKHDGTIIEFTPDHTADKWGILSMTNQSISSDMNRWRLAKGDIIDADGTGCIIIKNPILSQAITMDMRTHANNIINPTIVSTGLFPGMSCDTIRP